MAASNSLEAVNHDLWRPKVNPWIIAASVMLATILEVLDSSVANVALPQMAGAMAVTPEESTWVVTSYLVANAIVLPMTGWAGRYFGRKRFLMTCVFFFSLASAACGAAPTMGMLVLGRCLQGAAGGALQPLSQAILMESFPPAKRGAAMAVFGMGVVVAPIIGPTLGGWITDNYSWRWIFFINLPIGLLALFMCRSFIEDPPWISGARANGKPSIDGFGFAIMTLWLATLQIVLDKGQEEDWFETPWITWLAVISVVSMVVFIWWELRVKEPLVELRVLANRNFAVGTLMMTLMGIVLYSTVTLLPLFLQGIMGYTALNSGLSLSPRGMGAILSMMLVGRLIGRVDSRLLIAVGFTVLGYSSYMFSKIDLQISMSNIILPNVIMGMSLGLIFVPLTTTTMGALSREQMGNGTGIFNLMRNLGGGVGISIVTTLLSRGSQTHQSILGEHMSIYNPDFQNRLESATASLTATAGPVAGQSQALLSFYHQLIQQATLASYVDNFRLLAFVCLLCLPALLLFKKVKAPAGPVAVH